MSVSQLLDLLEENACILRRTQNNLKQCPKQRLSKGYIEGKIKCIEEYWQSFKGIHQELIKSTSKEHRLEIPYFQNEDFYIIEDIYICLIADLHDMLYVMQNSNPSSKASGLLCQPQVKLPVIKLPTFKGVYEEWPAFNDLFTSLIDQNLVLTNIQKLHYLKASLSGEAEGLLKYIKVTEDNYDQAWNVLKNRYGNKRIMIHSIINRLFSQRKMNTQTAKQIKCLLDVTSECIHNLKNLQICTDTWDLLIIYFVVQKFDSKTHKSWEEYCYNHDSNVLPTWEDMKRFLEQKFRTLELTMPAMTTTKEIETISETTDHATSTSISPVKCCILCKKGHVLCHCAKFKEMQPSQRNDFIKNKGLCYNCLNPGHTVFKCRVRVSCKICNRRHHTSIHEQRIGNEADNDQEVYFSQVNEDQNHRD